MLLHRFDDALISFREALNIRRHALGHLHPSTARIYNNIGCVHVEFDEMKEARRAFESALDVQRNALCYEPESKSLRFGAATTLCNLGYLYNFRSMHDKASMVLKEAAELQESVLGKLHCTVLSTLDCVADSFSKANDTATALQYYQEIISRFMNHDINEINTEENMNLMRTRKLRAMAIVNYKMSRLHRKQNDYEATLKKLTESVELVRELGVPELLERIETEIRQVKHYLKTNKVDWL